ncbi:carboxypeptidase-like regulatory domain-containing protein [Paraflavitalea pollutisoli]|uniref:carboxypeptidase-like regulatory domain-containing protein n=1 Tax=Paraflavitalea pollutisoli TaxID=3034143 RepID=UPI0023EAC37E|nr:carboxypeptidase-like regulatory domain-containing protein [Paraflavitalea sp. H1-2-19X]
MQRTALIILSILFLSIVGSNVVAQVRISGRVYDMSQKYPMQAVSVMSNSGAGTMTDSLGRYSLVVPETDSLWFSYLGKPTPKYAVANIRNMQAFEVSLHVNVTELKQVMVRPPNYKLDSIQNRLDYARAFDFQKPGIGISTGPVTSGSAPAGVGLDINEFINMFRFRRNRNMLAFQERLLREEQDKFIDHRFSRALVIKLTKLKGPDLDTFMIRYRPPMFLVQQATEYEFQLYIKKSYEKFHKLQLIMGELKKDDEP